MVTRALVAGSGGNVGFCWSWGVIASLLDAGIDLAGTDLVVGTSTGVSVALELDRGEDPHKLIESLGPPQEQSTGERDYDPAPERFTTTLKQLARSTQDAKQIRAGIGDMALSIGGESADALRRLIKMYYPVLEWPRQRLLITAVDAATGELAVFSQDSGG